MVGWALGATLFGLWIAWFVLGSLTVFETSRRARLEVLQLPHHVGSPIAGRVASASAVIGQAVQAGQVLLELDSAADRLRLAEEQTRLAGLPPRIASLRVELAALQQAAETDLRAATSAAEAARARIKEADAGVRFARSNEGRLKRQSAAGGVAEIDALRASSEADRLNAGKDAMVADLRRQEQDRQMRAQENQARMEALRRAAITLEGELNTGQATLSRIRETIDRQTVRAPIAGTVGDVAPLYPGAYVTEGQRLVSVVPPGDLLVVAEFTPGSAMGRIQPGQRGTLRLDGFPWAQFGSIDAVVLRVGSEVRDNAVRVELAPTVPGNRAALMQHGAPGVIEIAIERTSPAKLVLRAAGLLLSAPGQAGPAR